MLDQEVMAKYHSRRREDLEICLRSLQERNFDAIERIGHKLKGNGVTFGYPELSKLGEDLETSAQTSNLTQLQSHVANFADWVEKIEKQN